MDKLDRDLIIGRIDRVFMELSGVARKMLPVNYNDVVGICDAMKHLALARIHYRFGDTEAGDKEVVLAYTSYPGEIYSIIKEED